MTRFLFVVVRSNLWALCYINLHVLNVDCLLFVGCMVAHKSLFFCPTILPRSSPTFQHKLVSK